MSPLQLVLVWRAVTLDNVWIDLVCKDSMLQLNVLLNEHKKVQGEKKSTKKLNIDYYLYTIYKLIYFFYTSLWLIKIYIS